MRVWYCLVLIVLIVTGCKNDVEKKDMYENAQHSSLYMLIQDAVKHGNDLNAPTKNKAKNYTYLHLSSLNGDIESARLLIAHKANIDVKDAIGATPLHRAVQTGHVAVARLLLENGASIEARNKSQATPLFFAIDAENNSKEAIQLLLQNGADVNAIDDMQETALHRAASKGNKIAVELLLDKGADINARDYRDYTPLHIAALYGYPAVAELLLKHGADPESPSKTGRPIHIAMYETVPDHVSESGKKQVAKIIQQYINKAKSSKEVNHQSVDSENK